MDDTHVYWIWLGQLKDIGPVLQKKLLHALGSPEKIYQACGADLRGIPGLGSVLMDRILSNKSLDPAKRILEAMDNRQIKLLTIDDPRYPLLVKEGSKSPIYLYYRGNLIENSTGVAMTGTRRCSAYGKQVTIDVATYLAESGIPVISGLAKGIDGYAHTACLRAGGYTIAFLPCGLDKCYPSEHRGLMEKIIERGAVVSPFPPGTTVHPNRFPQRNYLIGMWSHKILMIEAGEKSGTLTTVRYARKHGRELLAVPNQIYAPEGRGTNELIAAGATIFLHPEQLLFKPLKTKPLLDPSVKQQSSKELSKKSPAVSFTPVESEIYDMLKESPTPIEQIVQTLNRSHSDILDTLSTMELEGKIEVSSGGLVHRAASQSRGSVAHYCSVR
jgi:DNA protecting protein DprA